jgi:mRNA deadenylase 3'-5' endonuclease subunit Ccr4
MPIKVAMWNLCLGLENKKYLVLNELDLNNIDVCCLQETEIGKDYPIDILGNNKYEFETELNDTKKRVGMYISKKLNYKRRLDLGKKNCHLIIIDFALNSDIFND